MRFEADPACGQDSQDVAMGNQRDPGVFGSNGGYCSRDRIARASGDRFDGLAVRDSVAP